MADLCVYCNSKVADTKDHAPPRCLLKKPLPSNLITFPACRQCNNDFSFDENVIRCLLGFVGEHPDLAAERAIGGRLSRALQRDGKLKNIFDEARQPDGSFAWTDSLLKSANRVFIKTAQGLFFGLYGKRMAADQFHIVRMHHRRQMSMQSVIDEMRPSPLREVSEMPFPDLAPHSWPMKKDLVFLTLQPLAGGAPIQRAFRLARETPVGWFHFQADIFSVALVKRENERAALVFDLWSSLGVVVGSPWPGGRGRLRKTRA